MKNISRILALVLALTMVIGAFASVSAAGIQWYSSSVAKLKQYGLADFTFTAEEKITRAEFALMVAKIDSGWVNTEWWDESVLANTVVFKDQADTDKAHRAAICYCYQRNLVAGDGDGNYRPNSVITLAEASVIITRLMGYANDVPQNGEQWQYNWIYAANKFCRAFDETFMSHVDTVNPDYELSQGEAAYLIATILNFNSMNEQDKRLTKSGEDLGASLKKYYTSADIARVSAIDMDVKETLVTAGTKIAFTILTEGSDELDTFEVDAARVEKLVRKSLGLKEDRDLTTTDKFNLGDYLQKGTLLNVTRKDGVLTSVKLFTGAEKVEANTYLVAAKGKAHEYNIDGSIKVVGDVPKFANAAGDDKTPQLRADFTSATYEVDGAKKYANEITFDGNKIVFRGGAAETVTYTVAGSLNTLDERELVVYNVDTFETMTAAAFKNAIPNLATGEYKVTFYDINRDGYYDVAVYYKSAKFDSTAAVTFDTGSNTVKGTVKAHAADSKDYKSVQLGTISAGVISAVDTSGFKTINGRKYYTVQLATIGNEAETKVAYIPARDARPETTKVKFTIEGYTVTLTVDSSNWTPFLDIDTAGTMNDKLIDAAEFKGLVWNKAVKYVLAGDLDATLTGDAANVVVYVVDTASATGTRGFLVKVEKTETGANTFNVTVATSGALTGATPVTTYFDSVLDARFSWLGCLQFSDSGFNPARSNRPGRSTWMKGDKYQNAPKAINSNWPFGWTEGGNVTPRDVLETLGFNAENYIAAGKLREYNPEYVNQAGSKVWVDRANGNAIAYLRNLLTALDATEANMADIYGKTLAALDTQLDADVTNLATAKTNGTNAYKFLNEYMTGKAVNVTLEDGLAQMTTLYTEKTLGELLDDFAVYAIVDGGAPVATFNKETFFKNVANNVNNVRTNVSYGYYLCFIDRLCGDGVTELAHFNINATGTTATVVDTPTNKYVDAISTVNGATGVKTFEVRASASVLWDIENAGIYNTIFASNTPTTRPGSRDEIVTGEDLIYVSIDKDASAQNVLKYDARAYEGGLTGSFGNLQPNGRYKIKAFTTWDAADSGWYAYARGTAPVRDSWTRYGSYIFLDDVNTAAVARLAQEAFATGNGLVELGDGTKVFQHTTNNTRVAVNPYYLKTPNSTTRYEKWWEVGNVTVNFTATQVYTGDITTYIPVTDATGAQIRVLTDAEREYWENLNKDVADVDAKYAVIDKLLYRVNTVQSAPKFDANGKPVVDVKYEVNFEGVQTTLERVSDADLAKVHTVSSRLLDIVADKDVYPYGEYEVKFDGETYYAFSDATVVVMTPNPATGNIDGSVTTLGQFIAAKKDLFVTHEQVYYTMDGQAKILKTLTVIGEYTDGIKKDDGPQQPETKSLLVYLAQKGATIETTEHGRDVVVKSTYTAVKVPSGESFGSIYRTYATYADAVFANSGISTAMATGFYFVDETGKIISDPTSTGSTTLKTGYVVDADVKGGVKLKVDGKEVDGSAYNWQFFYTDYEGNLVKAGTNTQVALLNADVAAAKIAELETAVSKAKDAYNAIDSKYVAAKAAALENVKKAEANLENYKESVIKNNRDGIFWGVPNSAVYTYFMDYKYTYQKNPAPIEFTYFVVDGVYCVITNSLKGE